VCGRTAVPLVQIPGGPDVVIAADEVDFRPGLTDLVQYVEDPVVPFEAEVGVVEPEFEDVPEEDQVVGPTGQFEQGQEPVEPLLFGRVRIEMEMGVGHEDDRRLTLLIHAAQSE